MSVLGGTRSLAILVNVVLAALCPPAQAHIYKCVNGQGQVGFQSEPCRRGTRQSDVQVTPPPANSGLGNPSSSEGDRLIPMKGVSGVQTLPRHRTQKRDETLKQRRCRLIRERLPSLKKQVEQAEARIKADCRQARDSYCDKSAEEIVQIRDNHFRRSASRFQQRHMTEPPILGMARNLKRMEAAADNCP